MDGKIFSHIRTNRWLLKQKTDLWDSPAHDPCPQGPLACRHHLKRGTLNRGRTTWHYRRPKECPWVALQTNEQTNPILRWYLLAWEPQRLGKSLQLLQKSRYRWIFSRFTRNQKKKTSYCWRFCCHSRSHRMCCNLYDEEKWLMGWNTHYLKVRNRKTKSI